MRPETKAVDVHVLSFSSSDVLHAVMSSVMCWPWGRTGQIGSSPAGLPPDLMASRKFRGRVWIYIRDMEKWFPLGMNKLAFWLCFALKDFMTLEVHKCSVYPSSITRCNIEALLNFRLMEKLSITCTVVFFSNREPSPNCQQFIHYLPKGMEAFGKGKKNKIKQWMNAGCYSGYWI